MKPESLRKRTVGPLVAVLLATLLATAVAAQEPPKATGADPPDKPAAKEPKKPRGRLPAYYGKIVDQKQRKEIYLIQAKFAEQIDKLKLQLQELASQRDTEVEKVLTDDQRAELARMKSERRARRRKASSGDASGEK